MEAGGESIVETVMYGKNTTAKSYSRYETLDTTPQDESTIARYNWKQYADSVTIRCKKCNKNFTNKTNKMYEQYEPYDLSKEIALVKIDYKGTKIAAKAKTYWLIDDWINRSWVDVNIFKR